jgi:hypothetical protein
VHISLDTEMEPEPETKRFQIRNRNRNKSLPYGSTTLIFITEFGVVDPDSTGSVDSGSDSNLDFPKQTMTHNKETKTFKFG